jgi:hypothetical protein
MCLSGQAETRAQSILEYGSSWGYLSDRRGKVRGNIIIRNMSAMMAIGLKKSSRPELLLDQTRREYEHEIRGCGNDREFHAATSFRITRPLTFRLVQMPGGDVGVPQEQLDQRVYKLFQLGTDVDWIPIDRSVAEQAIRVNMMPIASRGEVLFPGSVTVTSDGLTVVWTATSGQLRVELRFRSWQALIAPEIAHLTGPRWNPQQQNIELVRLRSCHVE